MIFAGQPLTFALARRRFAIACSLFGLVALVGGHSPLGTADSASMISRIFEVFR